MLFSFPISMLGQDFSCEEITNFRRINDTSVLNQIHIPYYNVSDINECLCLNYQFGAHFRSVGQPEKSILFFGQGLEQLRPESSTQWKDKGWLYAHIASAHLNQLNNVEIALDYYLLAYNILVRKLQLQDRYIAGALMGPIGNIYTRMGEFDRAYIYLNQALEYFTEYGPVKKKADILSDISTVHLTNGQYRLTIETIRKGLNVENIKPKTQLSFLINLGRAHNYLLQPDSSLIYTNLALQTLTNIDRFSDFDKKQLKAEIYHTQAMAQAHLNHQLQSSQLYKNCIKLKESLVRSTQDRELANMYLNYANHLFAIDSTAASLKWGQKVIAAYVPNIDLTSPLTAPNLSDYKVERDLAHALELKAKCLFKLHRENNNFEFLSASIEHYELAFEVWDKVRSQYRYDRSSLFVLAGRRSTLSKAIYAAILAYDQGHEEYFDVAYSFNSRSKNPLLIEYLSKKDAHNEDVIPDSIQQKQQTLTANVVILEAQLYRNEGSTNFDRVDSLRWEIMHSKNGLEALEHKIEHAHPQYTTAKKGSSLLNTETIQSRLKEDQTLIDYFLSDSVLIAFKISKHKKEIARIPNIENLENDIDVLCETIYNPFYQSGPTTTATYNKQQTAYCFRAHALHDVLIAPLGKLNDQLIIVPDGNLSNLPFELLLSTKLSNNATYKSLPYLLRHHTISYDYSALLWNSDNNNNNNANSTLLVAPTFENNELQFADATEYRRNNLGPLIYNIPEVHEIQKLVGGTLLTGQSANMDTFMAIASNYSIIHLASHAKLEEHNNSFSYIAFTPPDDDQKEYKLHLNQLVNLNTHLEMVVLSACETGLGEIHKGEGMSSLARGFAYGGSKSIITSLWQVNDKATSKIMVSFYKYLKRGVSKDEALRQAKLEYIDGTVENPKVHPFYWAGFVAIGDMSPIVFDTNQWVFKDIPFIALGSLFLLLLIYIFLKRRKNN